jgi:hypothetical protein
MGGRASGEGLECWKCGASLVQLDLPVAREALCPACHSYLHVCRMCKLYNPRLADRCEEPTAEHPHDLERANFCDYFDPRPGARAKRDSAKADAARAGIDALFGGSGEPADATGSARDAFEDLFGGKGDGKDDG